MRDHNERLLDILEAIERIEKYAAQGREDFENDELVQTWIVHHLPDYWRSCACPSWQLHRPTSRDRLVRNHWDAKHTCP